MQVLKWRVAKRDVSVQPHERENNLYLIWNVIHFVNTLHEVEYHKPLRTIPSLWQIYRRAAAKAADLRTLQSNSFTDADPLWKFNAVDGFQSFEWEIGGFGVESCVAYCLSYDTLHFISVIQNWLAQWPSLFQP